MDEQFLKNLLKPLRRIEPSRDFMARSKQLITLARQEAAPAPIRERVLSSIFEGFTFSVGIAMASLLLIVTIGSISYLTGTSGGEVASSFNNASLAQEADSIDFNLQIQEISYFDESAKQVALALDKISHDADETPQP